MTLPLIGDIVDDRYRVKRELARGGTSTIYEVRHAITGKRFAIKWLAPELAQQASAVQLFVHEAKICGRLEHPNTVQIYDVRQTRDSCYLLMELLDGESLEARLQRLQRFSVRAACNILLPCMQTLQAAHRLGVVHLDLKPSNIFLCRTEGRNEELPKVLDFGISKLSHVRSRRAANATISGTPLYMPPEQLKGEPADPRFDVYALGVVLYELVAGRPPFDSDDFDELVHKIFESQPTPLQQLASVTTPFAEIVARAMARDVERRFASMADFARALRPYAAQREGGSRPDTEPVILLQESDLVDAEDPPPSKPPAAARERTAGRALHWIALAGALASALLTWHALTRAQREPVEVNGGLRASGSGLRGEDAKRSAPEACSP